MKELQGVVRKLKNGKSAEVNVVMIEMLNFGSPWLMKCFLELFNLPTLEAFRPYLFIEDQMPPITMAVISIIFKNIFRT